jgi:hypothetical protein
VNLVSLTSNNVNLVSLTSNNVNLLSLTSNNATTAYTKTMMLSSMPLVAGKNDIAQNYIPFLLWLTRL